MLSNLSFKKKIKNHSNNQERRSFYQWKF